MRPIGQSILLIAICAGVMLPNLGAASLWDVDEGVNAEAAREMRETGTWIVPMFNYELRTQKPALLYWVQRISYDWSGVSEWSARFPAVLFSMGTVLVIAAFGRRMFDSLTGFLAGVILATTIEFNKLAHAATPDAPLIFFVTLTLYLFWIGHERGGRSWFFTAPIACALAILTKGPAFFGIIGLIIASYLIWCRDLKRLLDTRLISGILIFLAVAGPWYGAVAAETKGVYIKAFLGTENMGRFSNAMEGHSGWPVYYLFAILGFSAPWSIWFFLTMWRSVQSSLPAMESAKPYRFLLCWFGTVLLVFSCAATKLPNYIATLYPALALLTANVLARWCLGTSELPRWCLWLGTALYGLLGVGVIAGFLIVGGAIPIPGVRTFPALAPYAWLGSFFILGAAKMAYLLRKDDRIGYVATFALPTIVFIGLMAAYPQAAFDEYKAPKNLVADSGCLDSDRDIAIASYDYIQPSVTFYAQRKVDRLATPADAVDFLAIPRTGFLFVPESKWKLIGPNVATPYRITARRYDFLRNDHILVITNETGNP